MSCSLELRDSAASRASSSGRQIKCRSTTRRPLTPLNGRVSSSTSFPIMWAPVGARRSGSTRSFPAMRDSRTATVDYCVQLSGELDCELESGEVVHLKPGDVFINRGGLHTWVNNGSVPSVGMAVMVDALPNEVNGKELRTLYPSKK